MTEAVARCDWDEFLAGEARSGPRHELVGGRVFAMAGGTERHDLLAGLLFAALFPAAPPGCRVFSQNRLVRVANSTGYHPDLLMVCGDAAHERWEADANIIVEVLSDSTEDTDRREKAVAYGSLPELERYVLFDPRGVRRVEVATRSADGSWIWEAVGSGGVVELGPAALDLDDLFDRLDTLATT